MSRFNKATQQFMAGDGRRVSNGIIYIREGESMSVYSDGWDCDEQGVIVAYRFIHYPHDPRCEDALVDIWVKPCQVDCEEAPEKPALNLTKSHRSGIIDQPGQYFLHRQCNAEDVNVYTKRERNQK